MKVMILTAGFGTRLRPHTYSKPKPLVSVAGKPVLAHIIDDLLDIQIDELICVTGYLGDQIERYLRERYTMPMRFLVQHEMRGQADAIHLAHEADGPLLIVFGDGLVGIDKAHLNTHPSEGIIYCQEVPDPSRFGVAVVDGDGKITRLVEKPSTPVSNLAVVGFYYLPEARRLMGAIDHMIEHNIQTKGEYYLADALQILLERGEVLRTETVSMWRDCGTIDALLDTNRYLLENGHSRDEAVTNSVIVPPVYIAPGAKVENAVLGPHVSLGAGAVVRNAIVSDSIINAGAQIEGAILAGSVIGEKAAVTGAGQELNIGDASSIRIR
jgi:glucose-1-phosphate thymidylyltransferase